LAENGNENYLNENEGKWMDNRLGNQVGDGNEEKMKVDDQIGDSLHSPAVVMGEKKGEKMKQVNHKNDWRKMKWMAHNEKQEVGDSNEEKMRVDGEK